MGIHPNEYVETLARYQYGAGDSLVGTEQHSVAADAAKMRSADIRWDELPDRIADAYREVAELILGPAIRTAAAA